MSTYSWEPGRGRGGISPGGQERFRDRGPEAPYSLLLKKIFRFIYFIFMCLHVLLGHMYEHYTLPGTQRDLKWGHIPCIHSYGWL